MTEKKLTYKAETLGLPPLRMVLGEVPAPDPSDKRRPFRPYGEKKTEGDIKGTLTRLIGYLKDSEK